MRVVPTPCPQQDETIRRLSHAVQLSVLSALDGVLAAVNDPSYAMAHDHVANIGRRTIQAVKEVKKCLPPDRR